MPKRITIVPHLSIEELEKHYRQARTPIERTHFQIIWLLAQGKPTEEVAAVTGYSRSWLYELVRSYNQNGPEALGDLRRHNSGAPPQLDDRQRANLLEAIQGAAPDGGVWNGRKVADYLTELLGIPVSRQQGWVYLKQMELRLRVPGSQPTETDLEEQEEWEKKVGSETPTSPARVSRRYRRNSV